MHQGWERTVMSRWGKITEEAHIVKDRFLLEYRCRHHHGCCCGGSKWTRSRSEAHLDVLAWWRDDVMTYIITKYYGRSRRGSDDAVYQSHLTKWSFDDQKDPLRHKWMDTPVDNAGRRLAWRCEDEKSGQWNNTSPDLRSQDVENVEAGEEPNNGANP